MPKEITMLAFFRKTLLWVLLLPAVLIGAGVASNQLVLVANHDKFPVMVNRVRLAEFQEATEGALPDGMLDSRHCIMTEETHLNYLADIFDFGEATYSIGDGLLYAGEGLQQYCLFAWILLMASRASREQNAC